MAKFKIAQNPTFTSEVSIPRVGGDPIEVKFTFRVVDRTELALIYDKWRDATKDMLELDSPSYAQLAEADITTQVQQIKDIVVGWGFEDEFNDESIRALCNTCTGAASVIVERYNAAYSENRSKN